MPLLVKYVTQLGKYAKLSLAGKSYDTTSMSPVVFSKRKQKVKILCEFLLVLAKPV